MRDPEKSAASDGRKTEYLRRAEKPAGMSRRLFHGFFRLSSFSDVCRQLSNQSEFEK